MNELERIMKKTEIQKQKQTKRKEKPVNAVILNAHYSMLKQAFL